MIFIKDSNQRIKQNLIDCDCNDEIINEFMKAVENKNKQKALSILAEHRQELLDKFHKCDCCISCLDYLVDQIEKETY